MKVGIISTNEVQKALACELLSGVFGSISSYDLTHARNGVLLSGSLDLLIIDLNDSAVIESDEVMNLIGLDHPVCLLHEKDLSSLGSEDRIAWRNRTVNEIHNALPDLAGDVQSQVMRAAVDDRASPDVWVIGSSTGGPTALRELFTALPLLPITIFVAQHISSDAFGQMLTRIRDIATKWSVQVAENNAKVVAGTVYMVPRDMTVEIKDGVIILQPYPAQALSFNPCIDAVIRSMFASEQQVGVIIMSGMGNDGSAGIRAIKGKAKMILAQDHDSCGAKSMPDSARDTGAVDMSLPPAGIAHQLASLYEGTPA